MIDSSKNNPQKKAYDVNEISASSGISEYLEKIGLTRTDHFVRLSPSSISGLEGSMDCLGSGGIGTMFRTKYVTSGDCFLGYVETEYGNRALVFDCIREDKDKKTGKLCMDQDPIFLKESSEGGWELSACKISHGNWCERTIEQPDYIKYTSAFDCDKPYALTELNEKAKAIYDAIPFASKYIDGLEVED